MQTISGIHYNWSMPAVSSDEYFALIRNFRRHSFLLLYLFGASPAVTSSFVAGRAHELQALGAQTMHLPHATSLRMGRLGYQSDAQSELAVSYNSLASYGASLQAALTRPYPAYEAVGIHDASGQYRQLSTSLLQIENEFYGTIRPKRVIFRGERPLHALRERGVEYVEVRCMDLDPFVRIGIAEPTLRFLDVFLLHCLLTESPPDSGAEISELARNQHRAAARGREPGLLLERGGDLVALPDWGGQILQQCEPIAEALDAVHGGSQYRDSIAAAQAALREPQCLPSARVLATVLRDFDGSYLRFMCAESAQTHRWLLALPHSAQLRERFAALTLSSLAEQAATEAADSLPFELYRRQYLAPERLGLN
jgi:glutamate--cysteine ligase